MKHVLRVDFHFVNHDSCPFEVTKKNFGILDKLHFEEKI